MSNRSAKRSTILPLPSSPHWEPRMITFPICDQTYLVYRQSEHERSLEKEKRTATSQEASGHDTLTLYAHLGRLPGPRPGCVCTIDSRHLHREVEDLPDLRGLQGSRASAPRSTRRRLRKAVPASLATHRRWRRRICPDLAQAILVSHLDMIDGVLDFLGVPHEDGFFAKDMDARHISPRAGKPASSNSFNPRIRRRFSCFISTTSGGNFFMPATFTGRRRRTRRSSVSGVH